MRICKIDGCSNKVLCRDVCPKHYQKLRKYGDPLHGYSDYLPSETCKIEDCDNKPRSKNLCGKHYSRYLRYGDPLFIKNEQHGMTNSSEYMVWQNIKNRCLYEDYRDYHCYGGRGITICDRWKNSFIAFYEDMGAKPFPEAQIDREDNDGNYEPNNCRWTTAKVNARNRSTGKLTIENVREMRKLYKSGTMTQCELAEKYNIAKPGVSCIMSNKTWKEIS